MALIEASTKINKPADVSLRAHYQSREHEKAKYVVSIEFDGPLKVGTKCKINDQIHTGCCECDH